MWPVTSRLAQPVSIIRSAAIAEMSHCHPAIPCRRFFRPTLTSPWQQFCHCHLANRLQLVIWDWLGMTWPNQPWYPYQFSRRYVYHVLERWMMSSKRNAAPHSICRREVQLKYFFGWGIWDSLGFERASIMVSKTYGHAMDDVASVATSTKIPHFWVREPLEPLRYSTIEEC